MDKKREYVVGIDEAGRGPIAGPVAVGAVLFDTEVFDALRESGTFTKLRDSKKLSEKKREEWYATLQSWVKDGRAKMSVALVAGEMIDRYGIAVCIRRGIDGVLKKVAADPEHTQVLLDGGIRAPKQFLEQKTIIKGDEKEPIIALASIVAKVSRDRKMSAYAKEFEHYGFEMHKGYGTKLHYEKIQQKGITVIHRRTFLTKLLSNKENL
ncbi:MAG: ribonuclease HII [Candidatus Pacebacteria bacterium]|jgi:ribonuclease HII|nr:ribonuclease HII [Candidatus Paceibacterota bacterium]